MSPILLSIVITAWHAPGEIHRCVDDQGTVQFQEQPCRNGDGAVFSSDGDTGGEKLRRWLEAQKSVARSGSRSARPTLRRSQFVLPPLGLAPLPEGSRALAECSARVFACTDGTVVQMDRCVAQIEFCGPNRRSQCCHSAYISRYQSLRAAGVGRHDAVRVALLGAE